MRSLGVRVVCIDEDTRIACSAPARIGLTLRLLMYWTAHSGRKKHFFTPFFSLLFWQLEKHFSFFYFCYVTHDTDPFSYTFTEGSCRLLPSGTAYLTAATPTSCALRSMLAAQTSVSFRRFLQYIQTVTVTFLNIDHDNFLLQSHSLRTTLLSFDTV